MLSKYPLNKLILLYDCLQDSAPVVYIVTEFLPFLSRTCKELNNNIINESIVRHLWSDVFFKFKTFTLAIWVKEV